MMAYVGQMVYVKGAVGGWAVMFDDSWLDYFAGWASFIVNNCSTLAVLEKYF